MHYHFALSVTKINTFISLNSSQSNVHLNKLYTFYLHVQNNYCYIDIYINLHDMHFPCIQRNEMLFLPVYVDANSNSLNHDTWTVHSTFCT